MLEHSSILLLALLAIFKLMTWRLEDSLTNANMVVKLHQEISQI